MLDLLCFESQNLESRGGYEVESLHVLSESTLLCVCQNSSISINCQGIRAGEEKSGRTKKHKLHEMLDLFYFQSQNLESMGGYEVESLHVLSQSTLLCVRQISSKSINCQGIRASEEKSGQTKKHKLHEMLDLLCFQSQNLETRVGYEVESLHVLSQSTLLCVCQTSSKSINCQGIRASEEVVKPKSTNFTRCSTYSASNHRFSSQGEGMKLKVCMYLVNQLYYVCAKLHPNRSTVRV